MTLVELFDEEKIDNVVGTMLLHPQRTVFLCPGEKSGLFLASFGKILENRNIKTELIMEQVDVTHVAETAKKVEELVLKYPDADFDISGGDDVMLVTMGELAKKYNLSMHMASALTKTVTAINSDKKYNLHDTFLSVEELISLYGGKTLSINSREEKTYTWERNLKDEEEITKVWNVCKSDPGAWNAAIGAMRGYASDKKNVLAMIWSKLKKEGLVYREGSSIKYRSNLVKYLLQKQGNALEMYTYIAAKSTLFFDDGQSGVVIDWKGRREVENEIDVFLTKGFMGYFISCKNGIADSDELYKLSVVARRFGGKYAKKILVLTHFEPDQSFMERAKELDIKVIKNVKHLSKKDFEKRLMI